MRRFCYKAAMLLAMGALSLPSTLLLLASDQTVSVEAPAPCHQEQPDQQTPRGSHHDCCLVGHNHAIRASVAYVQPVSALVVSEVSAIPLPALSLPRPEPALTSFDPPSSSDLPLRI